MLSKKEQNYLDDNTELKKKFGPYSNEFRHFYTIAKDIVGDEVDLFSKIDTLSVKFLDFGRNTNETYQRLMVHGQNLNDQKTQISLNKRGGLTINNPQTHTDSLFINTRRDFADFAKTPEQLEYKMYSNAKLALNNDYSNAELPKNQEDVLLQTFFNKKLFYHELGHHMVDHKYYKVGQTSPEFLSSMGISSSSFTLDPEDCLEFHGGKPIFFRQASGQVASVGANLNMEEAIVESFANICLRKDLIDYFKSSNNIDKNSNEIDSIEKAKQTLYRISFDKNFLSPISRVMEMANYATDNQLYNNWFSGNINQNNENAVFVQNFESNFLNFVKCYYGGYYDTTTEHSFSTQEAMHYYTTCLEMCRNAYNIKISQGQYIPEEKEIFDTLYGYSTDANILYKELMYYNMNQNPENMKLDIYQSLKGLNERVSEFYTKNITPIILER